LSSSATHPELGFSLPIHVHPQKISDTVLGYKGCNCLTHFLKIFNIFTLSFGQLWLIRTMINSSIIFLTQYFQGKKSDPIIRISPPSTKGFKIQSFLKKCFSHEWNGWIKKSLRNFFKLDVLGRENCFVPWGEGD
jgi:hypothetical protein